MCFRPFPTFSDLLLTLLIFAVIDIPMFWLFIVMVDCAITIASDSDPYGLLVISDPSDAISTSLRSFYLYFTYHSHYIQRIISYLVPSPFVRLRITSIWLTLRSPAFYCVPRLYTAYIDLDTLRSTSFYCVLLIILRFSSRFIGFASISFDLLIHTSDYVYGHIPHPYTPLSNHFWSGYPPLFTITFLRISHSPGTDLTRTSHPLDHS
jgi:hypothetical protein